MVLWNPTLIVSFRSGGDSRSVRANDGDLIRRVNSFRAPRGSFRPFSALSSAALLREQSSNPRVVDEIAGAREGCEQEEVEEDAVDAYAVSLMYA